MTSVFHRVKDCGKLKFAAALLAVCSLSWAMAETGEDEPPVGYSDDWVASDDASVRCIELTDGRVYVFTNTASAHQLQLKRNLLLNEVLVVGGGGGGGGCRGGGGGAGGLTNEVFAVDVRPSLEADTVFTLAVGAGAQRTKKDSWNNGLDGAGSTLAGGDFAWAVAGGGGGGGFNGEKPGRPGACGGGGSNSGEGGLGTMGGSGGKAPSNQKGGAGGGMGGDANGETAGPGVICSITGAPVTYAAGGARGMNGSTDVPDAEDGTGNGGPGGNYAGGTVWKATGGAGGDGTVIIKLSTDPNSVFVVTGRPQEFGAVEPAYGTLRDVSAGSSFACTVAETIVDVPGTEDKAYLTGWELYTIDAETFEDISLVRSSEQGALPGETVAKCIYTHAGAARLAWKWLRCSPVGVEDLLVTPGPSGFTVSARVTGLGYGLSQSLAFKLAWGDSADALSHTNDIVTVTERGAFSLTVPVEKMPEAACVLEVFAVNKDGGIAFDEAVAPSFIWTGAGADAKASNPENWQTGLVPYKTGANVRLSGDKAMTWDFTDVVPAAWRQTSDYTGTVTLNTTQAEGGYAALEIAGDMSVEGGQITSPAPGDTGLQIVGLRVGGNLDLGTNGVILAMGSRFSTRETGYPGDSIGSSSHGGVGSPYGSYTYADMKPCYGSIYDPVTYGSRGRPGETRQGGGGVIKIEVEGRLTVHGLISASAWDSCYRAGSGGSVNIVCGSITGTKGWQNGYGGIWAQGSHKWYSDPDAGGGGRIALTLTDPDATLDDYDGWLSARGMGNGGIGSQLTALDVRYFSTPGSTRVSGAGTVYVRERNAAEDMGVLIVDNQTTLDNVNAGAVTEINSTMSPDRRFGCVLLQGGGRLHLCDGIAIETSRLELGEVPGALTMEDTGVIRLVGDESGNASIIGDFNIAGLEIDSSVRRLTVKAGSTVTVSKSFRAAGTAERLIEICSDAFGTPFNLNVSGDAAVSLDYLKVADCTATGAKLTAQHSHGERAEGWIFLNVEPGEVLTWVGEVSAGWGDSGNWRLEDGSFRAPVATDQIVISADAANMPVLPSMAVTVSNLTVQAGARLTTSGFGLTVNGTLAVDGALQASGAEQIEVVGSLLFGPEGTFEAARSRVILAGDGDQAYDLRGLVFNELIMATRGGVATVTGGFVCSALAFEPGASVIFAADSTVTVTTLTAQGTEENGITLGSTEPGSAWDLVLKGLGKVKYATVSDSNASAGMTVYAANSTGTGCTNWVWNDTRYFWTGAQSSDFSDAANWQIGESVAETAPDAASDIVIDAVDCPNQPIVGIEQTIGSVVVISGDLRVNAATTVARAVVVADGAKLTVDKPLAVDGDFTALAGSILTHTALPDTDKLVESYRFDLTVGGDMKIEKRSVVDLTSKGFAEGCGPGYPGGMQDAGSSHGGRSSPFEGRLNVACYGSIFAPTNCGSGNSNRNMATGSNGRRGGGAFIANVSGKMTLDGDILASTGYKEYFTGSGGSVYIRAGELVGSGNIVCDGGGATEGCSGGGGRIALVLTRQGATFAGYSGAVTAYGGEKDIGTGKTASASCGTVYWQDGNTAENAGVIQLVNREQMHGDNCTDLGYDGDEKGLSKATLVVGRMARPKLFCDIHVANLTLADDFSKLDLNGHTLRVHAFRPKHWAETEAALVASGKITYGGTAEAPGRIVWNQPGLVIMIK